MVKIFIRKLTDEEKDNIKKAKQKANTIIKARRQVLRNEIKKVEKSAKTFTSGQILRELEEQLNGLKFVTGNPILFSDNTYCIYLDHNTLIKLCRTFKDPRYKVTVSINQKIRSLTVVYRKRQTLKGQIEIFELPAYQVNLLSNLPVVEIA